MAAVAAARLGHAERVSVVEHLDELRARLIVSLAALAITLMTLGAPPLDQNRRKTQPDQGNRPQRGDRQARRDKEQ